MCSSPTTRNRLGVYAANGMPDLYVTRIANTIVTIGAPDDDATGPTEREVVALVASLRRRDTDELVRRGVLVRG